MEHTKGGKCNKHGVYTDKYCPGCVRAAAPALLEACEDGGGYVGGFADGLLDLANGLRPHTSEKSIIIWQGWLRRKAKQIKAALEAAKKD